jgi:CDP-glycerol glycerophosphotransferase (TagB/SpsB family)
LRLAIYWIIGRRTRYAAVVTTSRFYRDEVFAPAFMAHEFPIIGYPRNDFGQSLTGPARALARRNVDGGIAAILGARQRTGKRVVLVAPTFRESGTSPMQMNSSTVSALDTFAEANDIEFVFKFHPSEKNRDRMAGNHFHVAARDSDIYPLLPNLAALVTDYSSISMDFLLVDKPILFLIPEDDDYATADRRLQFHPRTMMPGPVVHDWLALLQALLAQWRHDTYAAERADLRSKAFDDLPQAEAVPKLIALMRDKGWVRSAAKALGADGTELHRD